MVEKGGKGYPVFLSFLSEELPKVLRPMTSLLVSVGIERGGEGRGGEVGRDRGEAKIVTEGMSRDFLTIMLLAVFRKYVTR